MPIMSTYVANWYLIKASMTYLHTNIMICAVLINLL